MSCQLVHRARIVDRQCDRRDGKVEPVPGRLPGRDFGDLVLEILRVSAEIVRKRGVRQTTSSRTASVDAITVPISTDMAAEIFSVLNDWSSDDRVTLLGETLAVLDDPEFAEVFAPDGRGESRTPS